MGYTRPITKAEIIEMILVERGETERGRHPYCIYERHPLMRKTKAELREVYEKARKERGAKRIISLISRNAREYLRYLENFGNECAYTDSCIECIITLAEELKQKTKGERT